MNTRVLGSGNFALPEQAMSTTLDGKVEWCPEARNLPCPTGMAAGMAALVMLFLYRLPSLLPFPNIHRRSVKIVDICLQS